MPQHKPSGDIKLFLRQEISAPVKQVFDAWTTPESIKGWFAPPDTETPLAEVDLRVGGKYRIGFKEKGKDIVRVVSGVYREIRVPHRLVFTWCWEDDPAKHETVVTIELTEKGSKTELHLTHAHFDNEETRDHHNAGWIGCVNNLMRNLQPK
ncbi:MAG TPA: SRPBCC domain-containing protein [Bacteroidota bacterium]|nr:SRPBCC domain-containing protein [Bacteroidota bacterium]